MSFTDTTGAYDATNNPGGWDDSVDYDDITAATIVVTDSAGAITTYNVLSQIVALTPPYSSDTVFTDLTIDMPDGLATVVYTLSVGATTYIANYSVYIYCDIKCCIFDNIHTAVILYGNDPCKNADKISYAMYLWALYQDFINAAQGCNFTDAATMYTKLSAVCTTNNTDCGC